MGSVVDKHILDAALSASTPHLDAVVRSIFRERGLGTRKYLSSPRRDVRKYMYDIDPESERRQNECFARLNARFKARVAEALKRAAEAAALLNEIDEAEVKMWDDSYGRTA